MGQWWIGDGSASQPVERRPSLRPPSPNHFSKWWRFSVFSAIDNSTIPLIVLGTGTMGIASRWISGGRASPSLAFLALGATEHHSFVMEGRNFRANAVSSRAPFPSSITTVWEMACASGAEEGRKSTYVG